MKQTATHHTQLCSFFKDVAMMLKPTLKRDRRTGRFLSAKQR